jgi:hypothetical protein
MAFAVHMFAFRVTGFVVWVEQRCLVIACHTDAFVLNFNHQIYQRKIPLTYVRLYSDEDLFT